MRWRSARRAIRACAAATIRDRTRAKMRPGTPRRAEVGRPERWSMTSAYSMMSSMGSVSGDGEIMPRGAGKRCAKGPCRLRESRYDLPVGDFFPREDPVELDDFDRRLLDALQQDSRRTGEQLAALVGLSPAACLRRAQRLRETGVIEREIAILAPAALGGMTSVLVLVTLERDRPDA